MLHVPLVLSLTFESSRSPTVLRLEHAKQCSGVKWVETDRASNQNGGHGPSLNALIEGFRREKAF